MRENKSEQKKRALLIVAAFKRLYPNAWCSLNYETPFQLLVATILSAQCTDQAVNKLTPALFSNYPNARAMAGATPRSLESLIHSSGFYKMKSKHLIQSSRLLVERFEGEVPRTMPALLLLPGVARKTANVVLYHAYGKTAGIAVDTHCMRISWRLGLTSSRDNQNKIERELMALLPRTSWGMYTNWMVSHGRKYCMARKPDCANCPLNPLCPKRFKGEKWAAMFA